MEHTERSVAQSGNGIDLGAVYRLLTEVAETARAHGERFDALERRIDTLGRDVDDLKASVNELRRDVVLYHEAVTGQGIHYSDLEGRMLRVERHLKLEPGE